MMDAQSTNPTQYKESLYWWHARYGPALPADMLGDVMRFSNAYDFTA